MQMNYDEAVLATQFPIVKYFIVFSRVARQSYQESQLKDEFWTLTIDAHLLRATINWCMVLGKDNEPTHWKRLVRHSEAEIKSFREGLFRTAGLDDQAWSNYWTSMTSFRDKFAAHRELEPYSDPVPDFDTALKVSYHYDNWLRNSIAIGIWDEPPLKQFTENLKKTAAPLINKLFRATMNKGNS